MLTATSLPAEVLLVIFECLSSPEDLLRAALVDRSWRNACVGLKTTWRNHWLSLKHSATHRRLVLAKNENEVDWFAESEYMPVCLTDALASAAVLREAAWETGSFTSRIVELPFNFRELSSVDGNTAIIQTIRPALPDEPTNIWGEKEYDVDVFSLVDIKTMKTIRTFPRIPSEFPNALHIHGIGHTFRIPDYTSLRTFYYIADDAYDWLGQPQPNLQDSEAWPILEGFFFLGSQRIQSEGAVDIRVDNAHTSSPTLTIHEQDVDNLSWIRWGPWNGQEHMIESGDEDFCVRSPTLIRLIADSERIIL